MDESIVENKTHLRGFGSLRETNPERLREIASKGGVAAQAKGVGHQWDTEEAREAGRRGGKRSAEIKKLMKRTDQVDPIKKELV